MSKTELLNKMRDNALDGSEILELDPYAVSLGNRQRVEYGAIAELAASILEEGQIVPIIVDGPATGPFRLVAGGRRLTACRSAGCFVKAIAVDTLDETKYAIIELIENEHRKDMTPAETVMSICRIHELLCEENKMRPKPWSIRDTAQKLCRSHTYVTQCLHQADLIKSGQLQGDVSKATFKQLRTEVQRAQTTQQLLESMPDKVAKVMDKSMEERVKFAIGDFMLLRKSQTLSALVPPGSIDVIVTDPNWGINLEQGSRLASLREGTDFDDTNITATMQESEMFGLFAEVLNPSSGLLVCCCAVDKFSKWKALAIANGFERVYQKPLIWVKNTSGETNAPHLYPASCYESAILALRGPESKLHKQGMPDWKQAAPIPAAKLKHPCEKPQEWWEYLLLMTTIPGMTVLDPFMGSGGSIRAAYRRGCMVIGMDKNPNSYRITMEQFVDLS